MSAQEVNLVQGSPEWLAFRRGKRMASETPSIMGLSPYGSPATVRTAKWGKGVFVNDAMRQGTEQEPIAREAYERQYQLMRPAVFLDGEYGASLDGINIVVDFILEIKTPYKDARKSDRWKAAEDGITTRADYAQIQHQLMVTGARRAHLWVWDAKAQDGICVEVAPDPQFWDEIKSAWEAFVPTLQQRDDPEWHDFAEEWKAAKAAYDIASERLERAKIDLLKASEGQVYVAGEGVQVERSERKGAVDWKRVQKDYLQGVDVEQYRKESTITVTIKEMKDAE